MLINVTRFLSTPVPQTITIADGASHACTTAFGCKHILLQTDTDCYVAFGATPTATSADHFMSAGAAWQIQVSETDKVAAIPVTGSTAILHISSVG